MTHEDFDKLVDEVVDDMRATMCIKNDEYAPGDDKLSNFYKSARMTGKTPEECLWLFCVKHLTSIMDIVNGEADYTPERLREKCGDVRNYTILLEALMSERHT